MDYGNRHLRSKWEFGFAEVTRRSLMMGMGYTTEELNRPMVAVVNSWNEFNPGHIHLKELAERVKQGIREAGGLPLEIMTTGICDGMVIKDPKYIELPSRNCIADQVELSVEGNFFDGMVMLCTCDSIVPGYLMAAARLDIPAILVTGGYMPNGRCAGKEVTHKYVTEEFGAFTDGRVSAEEYYDGVEHSFGVCGACGTMTTANSMCFASEAMGMSIPGNASVCATSSELRKIAFRAGKQIMELIEKNVTARQIMTPEAVQNAIRVDNAVGGSSNLLLHLPAIACEAGYDSVSWWKEFDQASREIPLLSHLASSGPYTLQQFDLAGGFPALMKNLMPKLNSECKTVMGITLSEQYANFPIYNTEIIRSLEHPVKTDGGMAVLYGNIAPEGCIVKSAGVPACLMKFKGKARCFNTLDDAMTAMENNEIHPGDACILRYLGLRGRFGTTAYAFGESMKGRPELFNSCAVITDGRYSGATSGLCIGYVSPEAALGGPLAVIMDGDELSIDIAARTIEIAVEQNELEERLKSLHWEFQANEYKKYLNVFVRNVSSMSKGGIWE